jgi:hypothetical protein
MAASFTRIMNQSLPSPPGQSTLQARHFPSLLVRRIVIVSILDSRQQLRRSFFLKCPLFIARGLIIFVPTSNFFQFQLLSSVES